MPARVLLFHPPYGNGWGSSSGGELVTSASCVQPSSSSSDNADISTKAEPFSTLYEDTGSLFTCSAPVGDVISSVNDTVVETVEVPDMETFESSLATDSNLPEVEHLNHVNVLFLQTTSAYKFTRLETIII